MPVVGNFQFRMISHGDVETCGLTTGVFAGGLGQCEKTYCIGCNVEDQLGSGGVPSIADRPVEVLGNHHFVLLSVAPDHTCGVTNKSEIHCWGSNYSGEIGNNTIKPVLVPTPVAEPKESSAQYDQKKE